MAPRVIGLLRKLFPGIRLTMIGRDTGDGSLPATRRIIDAENLADSVRILEGVDRGIVARQLDEADIFINTTQIDNTPASVVEAMACGLCVVSTNVGGIPYLLSDGNDSLLVAANDPTAMAGAVRRIVDDPALAKQLSANAMKIANRRSLQTVAERWNELLTRVCEQSGVDALSRFEKVTFEG